MKTNSQNPGERDDLTTDSADGKEERGIVLGSSVGRVSWPRSWAVRRLVKSCFWVRLPCGWVPQSGQGGIPPVRPEQSRQVHWHDSCPTPLSGTISLFLPSVSSLPVADLTLLNLYSHISQYVIINLFLPIYTYILLIKTIKRSRELMYACIGVRMRETRKGSSQEREAGLTFQSLSQ